MRLYSILIYMPNYIVTFDTVVLNMVAAISVPFPNTPFKAVFWLVDIFMNMHNPKGHQNEPHIEYCKIFVGVYHGGMEI
jgi:hypothetical protein